MEEEEQQRHEEHVASRGGVGREAGGQVPQDPVDDGADDGAGDLGDQVGGAEGDPAVDTRWELASLPEVAVRVELGHDRVYDGGRQHDDEEGGEHAVLHVLDCVAKFPEGEAVEDCISSLVRLIDLEGGKGIDTYCRLSHS